MAVETCSEYTDSSEINPFHNKTLVTDTEQAMDITGFQTEDLKAD
jgi:hypothetical protein